MSTFRRPQYVQLADELRSRILRGELQPGEKLPSIAELSERHETSTTTVRQALGVLRSEGHVVGRQGLGTFVRTTRQRLELRVGGDLYSVRATSSPLAKSIRESGSAPRWESESNVARASAEIASRLQLQSEQEVVVTDYRFFADDDPIMLSTSFEPRGLTRDTPIEWPEEGPLTGVVARFDAIGLTVTEVKERVTTRAARPSEVQQLALPDALPVFAIERTYLSNGRPVETSDIIAPGDRYTLHYTRDLPPPG